MKRYMSKDDFDFIKALNLPIGSKVIQTGKYLERNDSFALNERHFNKSYKGFNNG